MFIILIPMINAQVEINKAPDSNSVIIKKVILEIFDFLDLRDTPTSYSASNSLCVTVNGAGDGLIFTNCSSAVGDNAFLNLSGTNANQDINITPFDFYADDLFIDNLEVDDNVIVAGNLTASKLSANELNITNLSNTVGLFVNKDGFVGIGIDDPSHTLDIHGHLEVEHTADETGDHGVEIDIETGAFGDVKALFIDYDTGAIVAEQDEAIIFLNVDQFLALGGAITGFEMVATEGLADLIGLEVGVLISPILQLSGTFGVMDSVNISNGTNGLSAFNSTLINITLFDTNDYTVAIGDAVRFQEIEFILEVEASGPGIKPRFYHSTGVDTWGEFVPADGTSGLRDTGVIIWELSDVPDWAVGLDSEFIVRINRTANVIQTPPVELLVQITSADEFFWDELGDLLIRNLNVSDLDVAGDLDVVGTTLHRNDVVIEDNDEFCFGTDSDVCIDYFAVQEIWRINAGAGGAVGIDVNFNADGSIGSTDAGDFNWLGGTASGNGKGSDFSFRSGSSINGDSGDMTFEIGTNTNASALMGFFSFQDSSVEIGNGAESFTLVNRTEGDLGVGNNLEVLGNVSFRGSLTQILEDLNVTNNIFANSNIFFGPKRGINITFSGDNLILNGIRDVRVPTQDFIAEKNALVGALSESCTDGGFSLNGDDFYVEGSTCTNSIAYFDTTVNIDGVLNLDFTGTALNVDGDILQTGTGDDYQTQGDIILDSDCGTDGILHLGEETDVQFCFDGIDMQLKDLNPGFGFAFNDFIIQGGVNISGGVYSHEDTSGLNRTGITTGLSFPDKDGIIITLNWSGGILFNCDEGGSACV